MYILYYYYTSVNPCKYMHGVKCKSVECNGVKCKQSRDFEQLFRAHGRLEQYFLGHRGLASRREHRFRVQSGLESRLEQCFQVHSGLEGSARAAILSAKRLRCGK